MKIGVHHNKGSFSERWIEYLKTNSIDYKIVNCYKTDIVQQLEDCNALIWHHSHTSFKEKLFAKQLLFSLEQNGKKTFPNFNTGWHFDDKLGQKYLLESIEAPIVPSYIFYSKSEAIDWIKITTFPKVFKLRGGAGATNVKLILSKKEAISYTNKAFNKGFSQFNKSNYLKDKYQKYVEKKITFWQMLKGFGRLLISPKFARMHPNEKGYVYFQDFIPNNTYDLRVIVIGDKAFSIKRMTRKNDFRASGSGKIVYEKSEMNEECVKIAFNTNKKIKSQCIAYDFVFDSENKPLIVELSYGFASSAYDKCPGYWDSSLNWHEGKFNPQFWILEDIIESIKHENR